MINRDKYDALEGIIFDRAIFSHLATFMLSTAFALGIEMGVDYHFTGSEVSVTLLIICGILASLGLLFAILALIKYLAYRGARAGLFADDQILSDETILQYEDGSVTRVPHIVKQGASGQR